MKKIRTYLLGSLLFTIPLLQSCDDDNDGNYHYGNSLAVGEMVVTGDCSYIQLDCSQNMLISNTSSIPPCYLENEKRVIVNFTLLEENYMNFNYYVKINDIDTVLIKNSIPITPETADSIGNDVVNILDIWASEKYLTVQFEMHGNPYGKHMVNLVYDINETDDPDEEGYINREFRYNNLQSEPTHIDRKYWGIVSFRLPLYDIGIKGFKIKANTYQGVKTYKCARKCDSETTNKLPLKKNEIKSRLSIN